MPVSNETYSALTAMLTPAIFMTANGSLIISTSNRMSRIVDRIRVLNDQRDHLHSNPDAKDHPALRRAHIADQLRRLVWRSDRIRYALVMLYAAFGSFVGSSLTLAIDVWTGNRLIPVPTSLALVGVLLLLSASVNLVREALEALRSNRSEIRFHEELERLRGGENAGGAAPSG